MQRACIVKSESMFSDVKTNIYFVIFGIVVKKNKKKTNRMWFSVVCNLVDNDTRHYSSQNVVQQIELRHKARALL